MEKTDKKTDDRDLTVSEKLHIVSILADIFEGYSKELIKSSKHELKRKMNNLEGASRQVRKEFDKLYQEHSENYGELADLITQGIEHLYKTSIIKEQE